MLRNSARNAYPDNILNQKKNEHDSTRPDFWTERYATGKTPWQLDHVPTRLRKFIESLIPRSNILVPGCGQDFRTIAAFLGAGHQVTAIDFAPVAVEATKKTLPEIGNHIVLGDFFTYQFRNAPFDLIYERTFLCSLPPGLWKSYVARVVQLLHPNGVLAGVFLYGQESEPPPYPMTEQMAADLFGDRFELETNEAVTDSLPIFAGQERWQEWRLQLR